MWRMWGTVSSWICPRSPFPSPPPQWLNLGISLKITDLELKDQCFLLLRSGSGKEYAVVGGGGVVCSASRSFSLQWGW